MSEIEVRKAQLMELNSLTDLLRLVVSIMGRSQVSGHLYYAIKDGEPVYFLTHSISGWYDLEGLPVTLLARAEEEPESNFIKYTYASEEDDESYEFVNEIKKSTKSLYIPVIRLNSYPPFMS